MKLPSHTTDTTLEFHAWPFECCRKLDGSELFGLRFCIEACQPVFFRPAGFFLEFLLITSFEFGFSFCFQVSSDLLGKGVNLGNRCGPP